VVLASALPLGVEREKIRRRKSERLGLRSLPRRVRGVGHGGIGLATRTTTNDGKSTNNSSSSNNNMESEARLIECRCETALAAPQSNLTNVNKIKCADRWVRNLI
jgi:hypothetical protein